MTNSRYLLVFLPFSGLVRLRLQVLLGGGRRNTISNNTFIANDVDIAFDGRGLTWQTGYCRANCTDAHGVVQPSCFRDELEGIFSIFRNPSQDLARAVFLDFLGFWGFLLLWSRSRSRARPSVASTVQL